MYIRRGLLVYGVMIALRYLIGSSSPCAKNSVSCLVRLGLELVYHEPAWEAFRICCEFIIIIDFSLLF